MAKDKKEDNDSLLENIAQAFIVMKGVKTLSKYVIAPLAVSGIGYFVYRKVRGRLATA